MSMSIHFTESAVQIQGPCSDNGSDPLYEQVDVHLMEDYFYSKYPWNFRDVDESLIGDNYVAYRARMNDGLKAVRSGYSSWFDFWEYTSRVLCGVGLETARSEYAEHLAGRLPLHGLICFSHTDGIFTPATVRILAQDFQDMQNTPYISPRGDEMLWSVEDHLLNSFRQEMALHWVETFKALKNSFQETARKGGVALIR